MQQGRRYIPNHGSPVHSPLQRSPSAPPTKRARPTASIVPQRVPQQFDAYPSSSRQTFMSNVAPGLISAARRISGLRRVSSEGGRWRGRWDTDSEGDENRPNVLMPIAVLEKEFEGERDDEDDKDNELDSEDRDSNEVSLVHASHLRWRCLMAGPKSKVPVIVRVLIEDNRAPDGGLLI
ncbi:hypothetical protein C8J56DRAFT_1064058 [Mycena floridula]|nr:hypothetical protein C8J56DRAFT_1064058 [Mycena floridula]